MEEQEFKMGYKPESMVFPASKEDRAFGVEVCKRTPELIEKYGIRSNPIVIKGGLDAINDGFEEMKVSETVGCH